MFDLSCNVPDTLAEGVEVTLIFIFSFGFMTFLHLIIFTTSHHNCLTHASATNVAQRQAASAQGAAALNACSPAPVAPGALAKAFSSTDARASGVFRKQMDDMEDKICTFYGCIMP